MDCSNYNHLLRLTPYELHKKLINHYVLTKKGTTNVLQRDTSRDKRDIDVIRENHRFLWDDSEPDTWEKRLAKRYYDKLFKEYCICDLSYYKENKVAMRWQTEQELITGKGQFICGEKRCQIGDNLKTWEVNFGYIEQGIKKNALVKLRLCLDCSVKLNYKHKRKEVKRKRLKKLTGKHSISNEIKSEDEVKIKRQNVEDEITEGDKEKNVNMEGTNVWKETVANLDEPSRDEEFEEYLEHLLL